MSGANQWTLLGPDGVLNGQMHLPSTANGPTISGRVTCLALAEGLVFVGTAGGGLWMSADNGLEWTPLTDHLACHSIGALAYDADPSRKRLWIGSGEGNHGGRVMFGQGLFALDVATATSATPAFTRFTNLPAPLDADAFRSRRSTALMLEPNGASPPIVWWATNRGLFRSDDSGGTWVRCTIGGTSGLEISSMCLCQSSTGADRMLVAVWGDRLYIRTAATTFAAWTTNPGALPTTNVGGRIALAVAPSDKTRVYAAVGASGGGPFVNVFRSTAGGENWVARSLPTPTSSDRPLNQSQYNLVLTVHPTDPDTVLFGETAIWRSKDGGGSWQDLTSPDPGTHSDQHAALFDPATPTRVWFGNDGGVWLSTDGGDTMASRNRGLATLQYYALVHHPSAASVLLAGAQDNGTQRYSGSPGWGLIGDGDGFFCAIDSGTPSVWYASYVYRQDGDIKAINRSDSLGDSWNTITHGIDPTEYPAPTVSGGDPAPFFVPFVTDPAHGGTLYLGTTRLWRSTNRGDAWLEVRPTATTRFATATTPNESAGNSISCICVDPNDANTIHFGTVDGRLFRCHIDSVLPSGQAIATFTQARSSGAGTLPPAGYITDLAVPKLPAGAPAAPVYIVMGSDYLAFSNTTQMPLADGRVWKHDYAAAAPADWSQLGLTIPAVTFPSGPDLPAAWNFVNAIAIDPANAQRLFIGCHVGVFESTDGGASWARYDTGLPNTPVVDLQLHPTHRLLRAATMGRSVWERPIDVLPAPNTTADIYIRDNIVDIGRFTTPTTAADPLASSGDVQWFDAVDLKVDVDGFIGGFDKPASTVDYQSGGAIDYVGFEKMRHHALQRTVGTRVYLQVINRGPQAAANVKARVYWSLRLPTGDFSPVPADFWTLFPDGALPAGGVWQPVAAAQTATSVLAGEPHVFTFTFDAPDHSGEVGLLAVISCDNDALSETRTDVLAVATSNKHVVLRRVDLNASTGSIVAGVLVVLGMAAAITAIAVAGR